MTHTPDQIVAAVCAEFGGEPARVLSPHRGHPADAQRRWVAMHVYRWGKGGPKSYSEVGRAFDRDRTSVRHGERRLMTMLGGKGNLLAKMARVRKALG
jgi:chromosomal replication initiation ATPase DnaA